MSGLDDVETKLEDEVVEDEPKELEQEPEAEEREQEPEATADDEPKEEEPEPPAKPSGKAAGVLTKNGKIVLPYSVMTARVGRERQARLQAEAERDAIKQELESFKSKPAEPEVDPLDELSEDFPAAKALVAEVKALREQVKVKTSVPVVQAEPQDDTDPVQEAIDSVPQLAEWQAVDPEKWARATAIDTALRESPKWKNKPLEERFERVAAMVADEFDIEPGNEPTPAPKARPDPDEIVREAKRVAPSTLSDFKSGSAKSPDTSKRLSAVQMVERFEQMSDAEFREWQARG